MEKLFAPTFGNSFRGNGYPQMFSNETDEAIFQGFVGEIAYSVMCCDCYWFCFQASEGSNLIPLKVLAVQICCSYATYIFAKFACKTNIQKFAFAIPINLIMPVALSGIIGN